MADIGLSGSGLGTASLAFQIGDSIMRLKSFWDSVKDAPEEIKHLIEEIETLSSVLSDFETTKSNQPEPEIGTEARSRCIQLCRKAVGILDVVVRHAEAGIQKRRNAGSMKAVLKKEEIAKLRERLKTAQSMLMLCNQVYLVELQKGSRQAHHDWAKAHQHELQQLRVIVTESTNTILSSKICQMTGRRVYSTPETEYPSHVGISSPNGQRDHEHENIKRESKQETKLRARFQTPEWLSGVSRSIEIYQSRAGWDFNIRLYNVIPHDAPVFSMVDNGDIVSIQKLFSSRKASPFDRNMSGFTLLDTAAYSRQLETCRFLRNQGADPNVSHWGSAVVAACIGMGDPSNPTPTHDLDIVQLFAKEVEILDPFADYAQTGIRSFWKNFSGQVETLVWILQASNSTYEQRSLDELAPFILGISGVSFQPDIAGLVRTILGKRDLDELISCTRNMTQKSLLHNAATNLGQLLSQLHQRQGAKLDDLLQYITDLIKGGSYLHALTPFGRTPMLEVLDGYLTNSPFRHRWYMSISTEVTITSPLKAWLIQLKNSGIDMVEYGKGEKRVQKGVGVDKEWKDTWHNEDEDEDARYTDENSNYWLASRETPKLRLINFTYGPNPDDWGIWFAPVMEAYFMDFWGMIDHPERAMPGAWIEEYYDEYYD